MIDRPFHKGDSAHLVLLTQAIRALPDGWYDITVTPKVRATQAARGYFFGCVLPLYADYLGECDRGQPWGDDEAWDRCKRQFRPREFIDPQTGSVEVVGRSTKGMSPLEFFQFTEEVVAWLATQGVVVPAPDRRWREARERATKTPENLRVSA